MVALGLGHQPQILERPGSAMLVPLLLEERQLLLVESCGPRVVALHLRHESQAPSVMATSNRVAHLTERR